MKDTLLKILKEHRGKLIGGAAGLIFAVLVLLLGFWKSLFIALCVGVGVYLGSLGDDKGERMLKFLDRILPKGL
ncbi:DUF2273 domain-containing protein [Gehongia tenuis]|uniref:DUF2273 domain-containing protein n=1 Tax=Gehongia tenuis TaxID=2763655 RepID=A0A926D5B3_9FIRM|nr:DUF2273 domain-containing protein [Gehongia tenuis]MBC8531164.1 DUF2273 domain-containing protein [Gehongia tenuis]